MSDVAQFIAMPIDRTDQGLVAGEAFKCASPQAAIERARGYWKIFGHAGAVAFVRAGYPDATTTVLRRFGSVPEELEIRRPLQRAGRAICQCLGLDAS